MAAETQPVVYEIREPAHKLHFSHPSGTEAICVQGVVSPLPVASCHSPLHV